MRHGMAGLTRAYLERMPKVEICALHGVGLETSNLPTIKARGIALTMTPVLFDDVADLAIVNRAVRHRQRRQARRSAPNQHQ